MQSYGAYQHAPARFSIEKIARLSVAPFLAIGIHVAVFCFLGHARMSGSTGVAEGTKANLMYIIAPASYKQNVAAASLTKLHGKANLRRIREKPVQVKKTPQREVDSFDATSLQQEISQPLPITAFSLPVFSAEYGKDSYVEAKYLSAKPVVLQDLPQALTLPLPRDFAQVADIVLYIGEAGTVEDVQFTSAIVEPENPYFSALLLELKKMIFKPGELNGIPVKSQIKIQLNSVDAVING